MQNYRNYFKIKQVKTINFTGRVNQQVQHYEINL